MSWVSSMGGGGWGAQLEVEGWRKGPWTAEEDKLLTEHVRLHGEGRWNSVAMLTGLKRNGKSCRLRWVNYLRPDLKRGQITPQEENIILELHARWGNRWSSIARSLPGRTDNEIKNYWRTHFKKKAKTPPATSEKAKSRVLKRHHFQQQQQLQLQQQQVHLSQVDIKRIMSMLDETDHDMIPYVQQEDQVGPTCYTDLSGSNNNMTSISEASTNEDFLWDGLWNLDDFHGGASFGVCCTSSNACVQN